jgi:hypothetical protein
MQHLLAKLTCFLLILPVSMILFACSPAPVTPTPNPNLVWNVNLLKYEVKDKLESVETVQQYVGSTQESHQQSPSAGNVFLIMDLSISKQGTSLAPFEWSKLTVQDNAGNTYPRSSNDTFLELFKYTPRMTGLEIKLGVNGGWVCYEIPAQAAQGKLTLAYTGEGSQQQIVVKN